MATRKDVPQARPRFILGAGLLFLSLGHTAYAECPPGQVTPLLSGPKNANNGFPLWFQDSNGLTLDLCLDPANCVFDPPVAGNAFSEQIGFGAEAFWWSADAQISTSRLSGILVLATEAAFLNEEPKDGEQFPFTRLRIRLDVPAPGIYTVTHPYGVDTFRVEAVGDGQEVRTSDDIEVSGFNVQHVSRIGPMLVWDPAVAPAAPAGFVGDGATPHAVTGSPCGSNYFEVSARDFDGNPIDLDGSGNSTVRSALFVVQGKKFSGQVPSPLVVDRASYARSTDGQVDVFAVSAPAASLSVSGGPNLPGAPTAMTGDGQGHFFTHIPLADASTLPAQVDVTADNSAASGGGTTYIPNTLKRPLQDVVAISRAEYDMASQTLTVQAASSDQSQSAPPVLSAEGLGELAGGSLSVQLPVPPAFVMVKSSRGGTDSEPVRVVPVPQQTGNPPQAGNDTATTSEDTPVTINVLANDSDPDGDALDPATLRISSAPAHGAATVNGDGTVTYTPHANFNGADSFSYTVRDARGAVSNTATVDLSVKSAEVLSVSRASFSNLGSTWTVSGRSSVPNVTVTLHLGNTLAGPVIGTATASGTGVWNFRQSNSSVRPDASRTISIESSRGGVLLGVPVSVF